MNNSEAKRQMGAMERLLEAILASSAQMDPLVREAVNQAADSTRGLWSHLVDMEALLQQAQTRAQDNSWTEQDRQLLQLNQDVVMQLNMDEGSTMVCLTAAERTFITAGRKIWAIKLYKARRGVSLRDAKDTIDRAEAVI